MPKQSQLLVVLFALIVASVLVWQYGPLQDSNPVHTEPVLEVGEAVLGASLAQPRESTANRLAEEPRVAQQPEAQSEIEATTKGDEPESFPFWCRIVTAEEGNPIEGAVVRDHDMRTRRWNDSSPTIDPCRTDGRGLAMLQPGSGMVGAARADASGFGSVVFPVSPGHENQAAAVEIRMSRSASLAVRITQADSSPVVGARVEMQVPGYAVMRPLGASGSSKSLTWSQVTNEQGSCVFEDLPPETGVRARATRGAELLYNDPDGIVFRPGERGEVHWTIGGGARLDGTLVDQFGNAVVGQELWLIRTPRNAAQDRDRIYLISEDRSNVVATTMSESSGRFSFEDVAEGEWYVGPAASNADNRSDDGNEVSAIGTAIKIDLGTTPSELSLVVHRGLFIHGRVERFDGKEVRLSQIRVKSALGDFSAFAHGPEFVLGPLEPLEHLLCEMGTGDCDWDSMVSVYAGDEVVLAIGPSARLAGHFVDATTGEKVSARVVVFHEESGRTTFGPVGAKTVFSQSGLQPGTYHLTATSADGRVGSLVDITLALRESIESLEIKLQPGATLRLLHDDEDLRARCDLYVDGRIVAIASLLPGVPAVEIVPAGEVTMKLIDGTQTIAERVVTCRAGEEVEVTF